MARQSYKPNRKHSSRTIRRITRALLFTWGAKHTPGGYSMRRNQFGKDTSSGSIFKGFKF